MTDLMATLAGGTHRVEPEVVTCNTGISPVLQVMDSTVMTERDSPNNEPTILHRSDWQIRPGFHCMSIFRIVK